MFDSTWRGFRVDNPSDVLPDGNLRMIPRPLMRRKGGKTVIEKIDFFSLPDRMAGFVFASRSDCFIA